MLVEHQVGLGRPICMRRMDFKEEPRDPKTKWEVTMVWVIQNSKPDCDGTKTEGQRSKKYIGSNSSEAPIANRTAFLEV